MIYLAIRFVNLEKKFRFTTSFSWTIFILALFLQKYHKHNFSRFTIFYLWPSKFNLFFFWAKEKKNNTSSFWPNWLFIKSWLFFSPHFSCHFATKLFPGPHFEKLCFRGYEGIAFFFVLSRFVATADVKAAAVHPSTPTPKL